MTTRHKPTKKVPTPRDRNIGVRLPAKLADTIDRIARNENNGKSAVMRRLISKGLAADGDAA